MQEKINKIEFDLKVAISLKEVYEKFMKDKEIEIERLEKELELAKDLQGIDIHNN